MATNSVAIKFIKSNLRHNLVLIRNKQRNETADVGRDGVKEIAQNLENFTINDFTNLAAQIKRKRCADERDLSRLAQAFIQDLENIIAFVDIPGALNVIVKELTGNLK